MKKKGLKKSIVKAMVAINKLRDDVNQNRLLVAQQMEHLEDLHNQCLVQDKSMREYMIGIKETVKSYSEIIHHQSKHNDELRFSVSSIDGSIAHAEQLLKVGRPKHGKD